MSMKPELGPVPGKSDKHLVAYWYCNWYGSGKFTDRFHFQFSQIEKSFSKHQHRYKIGTHVFLPLHLKNSFRVNCSWDDYYCCPARVTPSYATVCVVLNRNNHHHRIPEISLTSCFCRNGNPYRNSCDFPSADFGGNLLAIRQRPTGLREKVASRTSLPDV